MNNIYGYIRVSTISQREDRQWAALEEFGIPRENVPDGFEDISFANDWVSCPTIMDKDAVLVIRQDYADPARRVMDGKRYRVDVCREELLDAGYEGVQPLFATDRFDEALAFAKEKMPELKDSIEEYIAEERREKILSYSNPKTRNAYDDFYAKSHAVAMDWMTDQSIYLHRDEPTMEAAAMIRRDGRIGLS